ncbi:hypothetical protein LCGC14_2500880, partial [marine sediment metagenome]
MTIEGTYCSLCGRIGLTKGTLNGEAVAFCPTDAKGPKDAHTAFPLAGTRFAEAEKPKKAETATKAP